MTKSITTTLAALHQTVDDAATFLNTIDPAVRDGDQSVHDILAHLVFWHREYVAVISAIAQGKKPQLHVEKFYELNALAYREFKNVSRQTLTKRLVRLQSELEQVALGVNGNTKFAFKEGVKTRTLAHWLPKIRAHIEGHLVRLRRIEKRIEKSK